MATTTKTLTPTNQTITLPDMTERPNASVLVDGIGKDADAINALSEQLTTQSVTSIPHNSGYYYLTQSQTINNVTISAYTMFLVITFATDGMAFGVKINGNGSPHAYALKRTNGNWTDAHELY